MNEITLYSSILITLVLFSAYFSAAETAFSSVDHIRLEHKLGLKKNKKHPGIKLLDDYTSTLSIILIANNLVNLSAASVTIVLFTKLGIGNVIVVSTLVIATLILIFGELLPKVFANNNPEWFVANMSWPLYIFRWISKPLTYIIGLFISSYKKKTTTEKELLTSLKYIESGGEIEKSELSLIKSAITFDDKTIKSIFTKWENTITIKHNKTVSETLKLISKKKHSRLPVIKRNKVIGVVWVLDLINANSSDLVSKYIRNVFYISRNIHLDDVLIMMQRNKSHIMLVTHKSGTAKPVGIITMEDLIEELVGEIYDETDETPAVMKVGHHEFRIDGKAMVGKVFKTIGAAKPIIFDVSFYEWILLTYNQKNLVNFKHVLYDKFKIELIENKGAESIFSIKEL